MKRLLRGLIALGAVLAVAACTAPYETPVIVKEPGQLPSAKFNGLTDLITGIVPSEAPAQVLWAHGMCSHNESWAADRINRIAIALGVPSDGPAVIPDKEQGQPYYVNKRFTTPNGTLTITFLIWSPMTDSYKKSLEFDQVGTDGNSSFPYTRASLNEKLKSGLMNDCL